MAITQLWEDSYNTVSIFECSFQMVYKVVVVTAFLCTIMFSALPYMIHPPPSVLLYTLLFLRSDPLPSRNTPTTTRHFRFCSLPHAHLPNNGTEGGGREGGERYCACDLGDSRPLPQQRHHARPKDYTTNHKAQPLSIHRPLRVKQKVSCQQLDQTSVNQNASTQAV